MKKYDSKTAKKDLPTRTKKDNKARGGKCLVIAGSKGMYGAAVLSCTAAARTGAGYTYLLTSGKFPIYQHPDFLLADESQKFSKYQALAIGPGYLNTKKIKFYIKSLIKLKIKNVILDAEALNTIAQMRIKKLPSSWIVTPHEGELSRILKVSSKTIRDNRNKYLLIAQKKLGCTVVLKGYKTLVANNKSTWEIQSGNPALAKAGTGDVLTGIILGFLSQNLDSLTAASLGVYVHGFIADRWVKSGNDILSLMASDLIELIPQTLSQIRK